MEVFRGRFIAAELLPYKELMFDEATEEWYAERDPVKVDWVESGCIRQAEQFAHLMGEYRERFFTYKKSGSTFRELPLAQTLHITAGARG